MTPENNKLILSVQDSHESVVMTECSMMILSGSGVRKLKPLEYFAPITAHHITAFLNKLVENGHCMRGIHSRNLKITSPAAYIPLRVHDSPTLATG